MIYLTLDTCVWLNLLSAPNEAFEETLFQIERRQVLCVTTPNLNREWQRHSLTKKIAAIDELQKSRGEHFVMFKGAVEMQTLSTADEITQVVEERVRRIDYVLNSIAELAPESDEIYLKASKRNLERIAPNHDADSFRDTVNLLTVAAYSAALQYAPFYFVTNNHKDFSASNKSNFHPGLGDVFIDSVFEYVYFNNNRQRYAEMFLGLFSKHRLPGYNAFRQKQKQIEEEAELERMKQRQATINEELIENTGILDLLLNGKNLNSTSKALLEILLGNGLPYRLYFLRNVNPQYISAEWLDHLLEKGYYDPAENLDPVAVEDGFTIPFWEALSFLEKLSQFFGNDQHLELVPKVLAIIKAVSNQPKDNYHTWHVFLRILQTIPNDLIPPEALEQIGGWLASRFHSSVQTVDICEGLLPKFLPDDPSPADIDKGKILLRHLFTVYRKENSLGDDGFRYRFVSNIHFYFLRKSVPVSPLLDRIVRFCGDDPFWYILEQLNPVLRNNSAGINWASNTSRYVAQFVPDGLDLLLILATTTDVISHTAHEEIIKNAAALPTHQLIESLQNALSRLDWPLPPQEAVDHLEMRLAVDIFSLLSHNAFAALDDELIHGDDLIPVFAYCLRELLKQQAVTQPSQSLKLLCAIIANPVYTLPFFHRLVLYTIAANWHDLKTAFWQMVEDTDRRRYFSFSPYEPELFLLLQTAQSELNEEEISLLQDILVQGPQSAAILESDPDRWRFRWITALKDNAVFQSEYDRLSPNYPPPASSESPRQRSYFYALTSPLDEVEILALSAEDLAIQIRDFRSTDPHPASPSIPGFADEIRKSIENNPAHFDRMLDRLISIPYIYADRLFEGYIAAAKADRPFDWQAVLEFCHQYTAQEPFIENSIYSPDASVRTPRDTVIASIGTLLIAGLHDDKKAYSAKWLPLTRAILLQLLPLLSPNPEASRYFHRTFLSHTPSAQLTRALLEYLLRYTRLRIAGDMDALAFEQEVELRSAFESLLNREVVEAYMLVGRHLEIFWTLDAAWIRLIMNSWLSHGDRSWLPFMSGLVFENATNRLELYIAAIPHYRRAIRTMEGKDDTYQKSVLRHLILFYLRDYESIEDTTSLNHFAISTMPLVTLQEYNQFLLEQRRFLNDFTEDELAGLQKKILILWRLAVDKYTQPTTKEEKTLLASFLHLADFFPELDDQSTALFLESVPYSEVTHNQHLLFDDLLRFVNPPPNGLQAGFVGRILQKIPYSYVYQTEQGSLCQLVRFLFENNESSAAKNVCNKVLLNGSEVLKQIYLEYTR
jgi:hypothetical protein